MVVVKKKKAGQELMVASLAVTYMPTVTCLFNLCFNCF